MTLAQATGGTRDPSLRTKAEHRLLAGHDPRAEAPPAIPPYLARLNPEQRAAALHGDGAVAGPLLIIAGAGTGKTNTLVHRLAHLVSPAPTRAASC